MTLLAHSRCRTSLFFVLSARSDCTTAKRELDCIKRIPDVTNFVRYLSCYGAASQMRRASSC